MRERRGFAMIMAMWFIVVITILAMQFRVDSRERRQLGIVSAERGRGRAADLGALNLLQAELEYVLTQGPATASNASLSSSAAADPWLGVDSSYAGTIYIDSVPVDVIPMDLGTQLNINTMTTAQLTTFFGFIVNDPAQSQKLTAAIQDWIDVDTITRTNGAEAGQYVADNMLSLPENAPFREIDQLLQVDGMTPDVYNKIKPYLTTHGTGIINVNVADTVVLKSLPGMSDQILASLLALRSNGQRITSVAQAFPQTGGGRGAAARGGATAGRGAAAGGGTQYTPQQQQLIAATATSTTQVELTFIARPGRQAQPTRLQAILTRTGTTTTVSWKQW